MKKIPRRQLSINKRYPITAALSSRPTGWLVGARSQALQQEMGTAAFDETASFALARAAIAAMREPTEEMLDAWIRVPGAIKGGWHRCQYHLGNGRRKLTQLGWDPELPLQVWRGSKPYRLVFSIGAPDNHVRLKAKRSDD